MWPQAPETPPPWTPDAEAVTALGAAGAAFLASMLAEFTFDLVNGLLILQAARVADLLTVWGPQASTDPKAARLTIQFTKVFAALLAQVGRP